MKSSSSRFSGYLFVLPYLILFVAFLLLPLFYGLGLSFTQYEMASTVPAKFVGLANYREAIDDATFKRALGVTALFVVLCVPLTVGMALLLATGLEKTDERWQKYFRLGLFAPTMITISVAGILWRWFYERDFGIFNAYLAALGIQVPWLTSTSWALPACVLSTFSK